MKTIRFFHVRAPGKPSKGGATVRVTSCGVDQAGLPQVKVQVAFCSIEDSFWRAMGRLSTLQHSPVKVKTELLPAFLKEVENRVQSMAHIPRNKRTYGDFSYAIKYFV